MTSGEYSNSIEKWTLEDKIIKNKHTEIKTVIFLKKKTTKK